MTIDPILPSETPIVWEDKHGNKGPIIGLIGSLEKFIAHWVSRKIHWDPFSPWTLHHMEFTRITIDNLWLIRLKLMIFCWFWLFSIYGKKQTNWNITKNNKWKRILFSLNFVQNLGYFCKGSFFLQVENDQGLVSTHPVG
jgi:hypothetical protein